MFVGSVQRWHRQPDLQRWSWRWCSCWSPSCWSHCCSWWRPRYLDMWIFNEGFPRYCLRLYYHYDLNVIDWKQLNNFLTSQKSLYLHPELLLTINLSALLLQPRRRRRKRRRRKSPRSPMTTWASVSSTKTLVFVTKDNKITKMGPNLSVVCRLTLKHQEMYCCIDITCL